jgi:hypothetical protein
MRTEHDRIKRTKRTVGEATPLIVAFCALLARANADEVTDRWKGHALHPPARVATVLGYPVYAFGNVYVYGVSPDFQPEAAIQESNRNRTTKVLPKKSWELVDNHLGSMVSWQPRTAENDFQPNLPIHLIDGNPATVWCSRPQSRPDVEPAWVRVDLPQETNITEIRLLPSQRQPVATQGWLLSPGVMPRELEIRISRDAWHWRTVLNEKDPPAPERGKPIRCLLKEPAAVKQIWIIARRFPAGDLNFSLAEIEALNEQGENVALAARGAGVTVSSTNYGGGTRETYDQMWPLQCDLGVKWMRLSGSNGPYHHDTLSWRFVEREKGKYRIDKRTDEAISEAAKNGIHIVTILGYGNWLYAPKPIGDEINAARFPQPFPPGAMTPEAREGYKNYARFMARHFKGRIKYYEIWNEPGSFGFEGEGWMDKYCQLFKEVLPVIKAEDPAAKVVFGGLPGYPGMNGTWEGKRPDGWFQGFMKRGVAGLMDGFGWQTQCYLWSADDPGYRSYPQWTKQFQQDMKAMGFKGIYLCRENLWAAPYPNPLDQPLAGYDVFGMTEIRKAKDMARMFVTNAGLGVAVSNWCNTWLEQSPWHDSGLFRITFAADPPSPQQPQPAYYVMRTLCTLLDQTRPDESVKTRFSNHEKEFCYYHFSLPGNASLLALWLPGKSVDAHPGVKTDVFIEKIRARKVVGIDVLNGVEQDLTFAVDGKGTAVAGVMVRDYPLILRITQ